MEQKECFFKRLFEKKSSSCCCGSIKIERKGNEKVEPEKTTNAPSNKQSEKQEDGK